MDDPDLDVIGPWSEIKLEIFREYSDAYTRILAKQSAIKRYIYIDGYAGAGEHISKTTGLVVPGSPMIALDSAQGFHEFHFVDLNLQRSERLAAMSQGRPNVFVHHGDCNEVLLKEVFPRCRYEDYARGLCVLDPYRLNVDWRILEAAGQMNSVEIFYNFMIMDANMNVFLWNPDKVAESQIVRMNAVWGDESWRDAAYKKIKTLFGEEDEKTNNDCVAKAFQKRLREVAGFKYVPDPIEMRNSTGATVYYLYFASNNPTGSKIASHILDRHRR